MADRVLGTGARAVRVVGNCLQGERGVYLYIRGRLQSSLLTATKTYMEIYKKSNFYIMNTCLVLYTFACDDIYVNMSMEIQ